MVVPGHQKSRGYRATLDSFVIYGHCRISMLTGGCGHRSRVVQRSGTGPPAPLCKEVAHGSAAVCRIGEDGP
jgi:hypothetical protein